MPLGKVRIKTLSGHVAWWACWAVWLLATAMSDAAMAQESAVAPGYVVLHAWQHVVYDWPSPAMQDEYEARGWYDPSHCAITGIKAHGDDIYVSVPRWMTGVPATLCKVVSDASVDGNVSRLQPFPSWEAQNTSNPDNLLYVQSFEIVTENGHGIMYILDVGYVGVANVTCLLPSVSLSWSVFCCSFYTCSGATIACLFFVWFLTCLV